MRCTFRPRMYAHTLLPRLILVVVPSASCILTGCGDSASGDRAIHRDSSGVEIVISSAVDRPLTWRFEPDIELGGADEGPESFYRVRQGLVDVDGSGNLYILSPTEASVTAFDASGRHRWTAGNPGGGPGEMLSPNSLSVSPEGIVYVHDSQKGALVAFDSTGTPLPQIDFPFGIIRAWAPHFHVLPGAFAVLGRPSFQGSDDRPTFILRIEGQDTTVLLTRTLPISKTAAYPNCGMVLTMPTLFAAHIRWDRSRDRIAVVSGTEYAVEIYEGDRLIRILRRSIEPTPVTQAQALEVLRSRSEPTGPLAPCGGSAMERLENHGFASELQIVQALSLAPDGTVWIRRTSGIEGAPGPIDVFSEVGEYVGTLASEAPFPIVFLPDGRVGYSYRDELEIERLVIARILR